MLPMHGLEAKRILSKASHFASSGAMIRAHSAGSVRPNKGPGIRARYVLDDADRLRSIRASKHAAKLWLTGLGADFVLLPLYGESLARSMEEVDALLPDDLPPGKLIGFTSHPLATCSIGRATDANGRVPGTENIYCMDGSALPSNVGRNPQVSVMTVARTLAERLTESLGKTPKPLYPKGPAPWSVPQPGIPAGVTRDRLPLVEE